MPSSPGNDDQSSFQKSADEHAEEILARRRDSRARRAAALAAHPRPVKPMNSGNLATLSDRIDCYRSYNAVL
jgi:hypothetical protein